MILAQITQVDVLAWLAVLSVASMAVYNWRTYVTKIEWDRRLADLDEELGRIRVKLFECEKERKAYEEYIELLKRQIT